MNKSMLPSRTTTKTHFHNQVIYTPQAFFFNCLAVAGLPSTARIGCLPNQTHLIQMGVSDKGYIKNVQYCGSPGLGLGITGL